MGCKGGFMSMVHSLWRTLYGRGQFVWGGVYDVVGGTSVSCAEWVMLCGGNRLRGIWGWLSLYGV